MQFAGPAFSTGMALMQGFDVTEDLAALEVPTLVITGDDGIEFSLALHFARGGARSGKIDPGTPRF